MNIEAFLNSLSGFIWGPFTLSLLFLVGLYLMIGLRAYPLKNLNKGFKFLFKKPNLSNKRKRRTGGDISSFESLMTALSATVGTGNIAGVATAIFLGGPGAIFWMWLTALVGMATKYAEAFLAIFYRDRNKQGNFVGGPMYYIKNGLEKKYHFLAYAFAFFGMIAAFGIGNGVQSNSVAQVVSMELNISQVTVGFIIAILVMLVILGGIKKYW
jgi:Na+/alanine symporter